MQKKRTIFFIGCFLISSVITAQVPIDTLQLKLPEAEKFFVDSNLQLLAQHYNVDAQRALIIQAKLWPNPNFSVSHALYSGTLNQFFPSGQNDETTAQISQLILLAGKRNKQIKLAQENTKLSEYQFFDLLRTLKYTLRTDFFNIFYLQKSATVYDVEIKALQQIVNAFADQEGKGYIAQKEVVRLKAQLYDFQSEFNDLINRINDVQSELKLILQLKPTKYINPVPDSATIATLDPNKYALNELVDSAYKNRTDLQIARTSSNINKLNYNYQKSLSVPDLTLSLGYDEQGSFLANYLGIGAAIDLPIFNRNQGNIQSAKAMVALSNANEKSTMATVEENVNRSLQKAFAQNKLYQNIDKKFSSDFERLMNEVLINYQKRNISILEFLDFYDSYKQTALQVNAMQYNRIQAFEDINYYTGTNFFN